jgi:hypothetical protein
MKKNPHSPRPDATEERCAQACTRQMGGWALERAAAGERRGRTVGPINEAAGIGGDGKSAERRELCHWEFYGDGKRCKHRLPVTGPTA